MQEIDHQSDIKIARQFSVDGHLDVSATREHVILDMTSRDEEGDWAEGAEDSLPAIVGVRAELAAGDLRPLYLAWLAAYGTWERDEDAFTDDHEDEDEPPVPAGLGSLSAPQRALADFLRLDADMLEVAAEASPPPADPIAEAHALAAHIAELPSEDKDRLLTLVARDQAPQARRELLRGIPAPKRHRDASPRRTVAELLDTAGALRLRREKQAAAQQVVPELPHMAERQ